MDRNVMHIVGYTRHYLDRLGLATPRAMCGKKLSSGQGAAYNAPMCPACMRLAGWTHDKRR